MSDHTRNFLISHRELARLVEEVRKADFKSEEGQSILMASGEFILSHFSRVCLDHCVALSKEAESDIQLARVIKLFSVDMQIILTKFREFFGRYENVEHSLEYAAEYGRIYAALAHSIHKQHIVISMLERHGKGIRLSDHSLYAEAI